MYSVNKIFMVLTLILIFNTIAASQTILLRPAGLKNIYSGSTVLNTISPDTIINDYEFNTVFSAAGQDILAAWFVCPADLTIKAFGYDCGDNSGGVNAEIKIVKVNKSWSNEMMSEQGSRPAGYWIGGENSFHPYPSSSLNWVSPSNLPPLFEEDIWSDEGIGAPVIALDDGSRTTFQWVEMSLLNNEPELKEGDIFAVCIKNTEPVSSGKILGIFAASQPGNGVLKYYANGRELGDSSTAGWWQREYMLNAAIAVEITGDFPPLISSVDELKTTLSTDERNVSAVITDQNPNGGTAGIQIAEIQYFTNNDSIILNAAMVNTGGNIFEGVIPGQSAGTKMSYRVRAVDVMNNESFSEKWISYRVFAPGEGVRSLLVLNGFTEDTTISCFGIDDFTNFTAYEWQHDVWSYGELTPELVNHYYNIFELTNSAEGGDKIIYNDEVIRKWLKLGSGRNYALAGQEWLGARYGFNDRDFAEGDFEYDVFGITHLYNDAADSLDSEKPSRLFPAEGSLLGNELFSKAAQIGIDSVMYDPLFESGLNNWIDAFEVIPDQPIDLEVESRYNKKLTCITHRTLASGNKTALISFDPLSVNANAGQPGYYKFGLSLAAPQIKILQWFDVQTHAAGPSDANMNFELHQNYPNPFNPETTIEFSIAEKGNVSLTVFNLLGEKIVTLVDEVKDSGNYRVSFNAWGLSSGIYYYSLISAGQTSVSKMILLR